MNNSREISKLTFEDHIQEIEARIQNDEPDTAMFIYDNQDLVRVENKEHYAKYIGLIKRFQIPLGLISLVKNEKIWEALIYAGANMSAIDFNRNNSLFQLIYSSGLLTCLLDHIDCLTVDQIKYICVKTDRVLLAHLLEESPRAAEKMYIYTLRALNNSRLTGAQK